MPHPDYLPQVEQRKNPLSPLMLAKTRARKGVVINACPFGCEAQQLDEHGYCRHLVGFTNDPPGQKTKHFEPMVMGKKKMRVVQVPAVIDEEMTVDPDDPVLKPKLLRVEEGDILVQITTSYRVYRNVSKQAKIAMPVKPELAKV